MQLKPVTVEDKLSLLTWTNDVELWPFILKHQKVTKEEHEAFFQSLLIDTTRAYFIIEDQNIKKGLCGFRSIDAFNHKAELFIFLEHPFRNKGLGSKALKQLVEFGFNHHKFHKISLRVAKDNLSAYTLYKKEKFLVEGTLKDEFFYNNTYHDVLIMAIIKKESNESN